MTILNETDSGSVGKVAPQRLSFDELRARFSINGKPMPVRTARRQLAGIPHIKAGRRCLYPIECVEEFERKRTVR